MVVVQGPLSIYEYYSRKKEYDLMKQKGGINALAVFLVCAYWLGMNLLFSPRKRCSTVCKASLRQMEQYEM